MQLFGIVFGEDAKGFTGNLYFSCLGCRVGVERLTGMEVGGPCRFPAKLKATMTPL